MRLHTIGLYLGVAVAGCHEAPTKPQPTTASATTPTVPQVETVLREARETIAEGRAFVAAHDRATTMMKGLEEDGLLAVASLLSNCHIDSPDEDLVVNRARLKPFLSRLNALDRPSTDCTSEHRDLAEEIVAVVSAK
jgi:hypothetical protein